MTGRDWSEQHGRALRERRRQKGFTQEALAEAAGIGTRTVKKLESASVEPRLSTLELLASALGCETHELQLGTSLPSLAVLPFANMSGDSSWDYFADGISEEITTALANVPGLRVVARTSAFALKDKQLDVREMGRLLHADLLLEGSVQIHGNRLRATAQLVKAEDGYHLLSERFDGMIDDIFRIQDDVALRIVDAMEIELLGDQRQAMSAKPTANIDTYHLILESRGLLLRPDAGSLVRATELCKRVLKREPQCMSVYDTLLLCYTMLATLGHTTAIEVGAEATAMARKALRVDGSSPHAHQALGLARMMFEWDWEGAIEEFRHVMELDPSYYSPLASCGGCLFALGRMTEARTLLGRALELEPFSFVAVHLLSAIHIRSGDFQAARGRLREYQRLFPEMPSSHHLYGQLLFVEGDMVRGLTLLREAVIISNRGPVYVSALGWASARSGNEGEAREMLSELHEQATSGYVPPYLVAKIYAGLGDVDQAFDWLERAMEARDTLLLWVQSDETLESLHADPRFADLLRRMNLPVQQQA